MDAEKIISTKKFYELTPTEKEIIKNYAQNETEFNEIKFFLQATKNSFNQQKINTSKSLNHAIIEYLHQPITQKKTWLNSIIIFLFPKEKRIYQTPAFQISLAVITLIFIINIFPKLSKDQPLAVNDINRKENLTNPLPSDNELTDKTIELDKKNTPESNPMEESNSSNNKLSVDISSPIHEKPIIKNNTLSGIEMEDNDDIEELMVVETIIAVEEELSLKDEATDNYSPNNANETNSKTTKQRAKVSKSKKNSYDYSTSTSAYKEIDTPKTLSLKNTSELFDLFYISK
ncbi:MAG TPA: hypothetical protein EYG85_02135 [Crocinitomix sp.]|nr:hypothetical protein [Crocinitomix sp.]